MARLAEGDTAPNFDLASTEDAVLMLRDEVPRSAVLLYFFGAPADQRARRDLSLLASHAGSLVGAKALGVSPAKLDELKSLQRELELPFPLLSDDRGFSGLFGFENAEEGESAPVLVLVNRDQKVLWQAKPLESMETALEEIRGRLKSLPSSTANYPRSVINRLVDLWVN